jgi:4-amino-4-deoxy-L-arabinose transferase-like glycosyltransferase
MATANVCRRPQKRSLVILISIWFFTQFVGIFSPPLLDDVDGIHVEAAREMASRHDYVTLYVDGIRYLDKPPLPYWAGALGIRLFGPHDWAVRLTLAITVLILTLYLYSMGRRWFSERAGFYSACAFATAIGPYLFTRFFIPDVIVALWMTIAADLILRMVESLEKEGGGTRLQAILFGLVCTAAVLTKGLIGIVFPVGLLLLYLLITGRGRYLLKMHPILSAGTFLLTVLPWHILAALQNRASGESRGWVWFYFVNEQINRYLNKRIPRDYDKVPLLTFWLLLIVWLMPWGVFLLGAARRWWRIRRPLRHSGPSFLFALWAVLIVVFFTFSTRQEYYTLPAVPALALLVGTYLATWHGAAPVRAFC